MKKKYYFYIDESDYRLLRQKVLEAGFSGRGSLSYFLAKVSREPIVFLDSNLKNFTGLFELKEK